MSVSLVQLFEGSRRAALLGRLDHATSLQDVAGVIQDEFEGLAYADGPYVSGLTKAQLPVALAIITLVKDSSATLPQAASPLDAPLNGGRQDSTPRPRTRASSRRSGTRAVPGDPTAPCAIVTLSASVGASAGFFFGPLGAVIGAAMMGAGATFLARQIFEPKTSDPSSREEVIITLDKEKMCNGFAQLLNRIDALVARFDEIRNAPRIEQRQTTLADFPDILRLFQLAWSAVRTDSREEMAAIVQRQFPSELRGFGLEVVKLSDEELASGLHDDKQQELLDMDFSKYVSKPTLDYPPICAKDTVVVKGRVLFPQDSSAPQE